MGGSCGYLHVMPCSVSYVCAVMSHTSAWISDVQYDFILQHTSSCVDGSCSRQAGVEISGETFKSEPRPDANSSESS